MEISIFANDMEKYNLFEREDNITDIYVIDFRNLFDLVINGVDTSVDTIERKNFNPLDNDSTDTSVDVIDRRNLIPLDNALTDTSVLLRALLKSILFANKDKDTHDKDNALLNFSRSDKTAKPTVEDNIDW